MADNESTNDHIDPIEPVEPAEGANPDELAVEGAVPPGYDWPTHGGYLGCLIGLVASLLVGGFLGTTIFAALSYSRVVSPVVSLVLTICVFLVVTFGLCRLGWALGKRFYRDYTPNPPPSRSQYIDGANQDLTNVP